MIKSMGANKTEKAIQRSSKAAGGVKKIMEAFGKQVSIHRKSSSHSHKSSLEDENYSERFKKFEVFPPRQQEEI